MNSAKAGHVFVAGSANIDLVASVQRLPRPGETVLAGALATLAGGKGRQPGRGRGEGGVDGHIFRVCRRRCFCAKLVTVLAAAGVDLSFLDRSAAPTGTALISVDENGQNQISIFPGANLSLRFSGGFGKAARGDVLLCQNECPPLVILEYMQAAKRQHVTAILNAAPVVNLPDVLWKLVDVLVVNEEEAAQVCSLLGGDAPAPANVNALAQCLQLRREQAVIITLGDDGAVALVGDRWIRVPGHRVKAVDTTGAGDCFCGYLASCLAAGRTLDDSIALANAAAAVAVQRHGASVAMPSRPEVEAFLAADSA